LLKYGESRSEESHQTGGKGRNTNPKSKAAKTKAVAKSVTPTKKLPSVKAQVVSKGELRAQLEKANATIATLRTKAREATRAAKTSAAQLLELETKLAKLEKKSSAQEKPPLQATIAVKPAKQQRRKAAEKADAGVGFEAADQDLTESAPREDD
jgi:hypothetical protein